MTANTQREPEPTTVQAIDADARAPASDPTGLVQAMRTERAAKKRAPLFAPRPTSSAAATDAARRRSVPLDQVREDPNNARLVFDPAGIKALADTIQERRDQGLPGLVYPVPVRPHPEGGYVLVDGARRYRAHQILKLKEIDIDVQDLDDKAAGVAAALANLQRQDLTEYEQARAFQRLLDLGLSKPEISDRAGVAYNTVKARLQLLELPEAIARRVGVNGFGMAHVQPLRPLIKHPELLAVVAKELEKADPVPNASKIGEVVVGILEHKKLAATTTNAPWELRHEPGFVKAVGQLPGVEIPTQFGATRLVLDPKALKATEAEWAKKIHERNVRQQAKEAKSRVAAKPNPAEAQKAADRERQDRKAEEHARRIAGRQVAANVKVAKHRGPAAWQWFWHIVDEASLDLDQVLAVGGAIGFKPDEVRKALTPALDGEGSFFDGKGRDDVPHWFAKATSDQVLGFLLALRMSDEIGRYSEPKAVRALTGHTWGELVSLAKAELRAEAKTAGKSTPAMGTNVRVPHDEVDLDEEAGDVEIDVAAKRPNVPKAKAKASKATKAPAKAKGAAKASRPARPPPKGATAALVKAKAKLAKAKTAQARLG